MENFVTELRRFGVDGQTNSLYLVKLGFSYT